VIEREFWKPIQNPPAGFDVVDDLSSGGASG
jgi:hypothetical protein